MFGKGGGGGRAEVARTLGEDGVADRLGGFSRVAHGLSCEWQNPEREQQVALSGTRRCTPELSSPHHHKHTLPCTESSTGLTETTKLSVPMAGMSHLVTFAARPHQISSAPAPNSSKRATDAFYRDALMYMTARRSCYICGSARAIQLSAH